jgi:hypothetical protein
MAVVATRTRGRPLGFAGDSVPEELLSIDSPAKNHAEELGLI